MSSLGLTIGYICILNFPMDFHLLTLNNGIRVIFKETDREVAHCGLVINAGSRDELEHEEGLAHFIEHCIFKGTKKRKTYHILSRLDSVGAEINAYTTKEETWVYASFVKKHLERSVELITDICFSSIFPEKEIRKEKDVIIDEINAYQDSPGEQIFDDFEEVIFAGHPLGRSILGNIDSVQKLKREDIFHFIARRHQTHQMVFSIVGDYSLKDVKRIVEKHLGSIPECVSEDARSSFLGYSPAHLEKDRDTHQIHYLLGNEAYSASHPKRTGLILLNNLLGGPGMNSRLNLMIREKYGIAYNIESHYQGYSDTGLVQIYLGTDEKSFAKSLKLVNAELKKLREKKLGTTQLHSAKQQLIGQIALSQESGAGNMLALGKSLLLFDRIDSLDVIFQRIESLTASEIMEIANEVFDPSKMSSICYY